MIDIIMLIRESFSVSTYSPKSAEYKTVMQMISPIVDDHHKNMKKGDPQLNYCDKSVMVRAYSIVYSSFPGPMPSF